MGAGLVAILTGSIATIVLIILAFKMWTSGQHGDMSKVGSMMLVFFAGLFVYGLSQDHSLLNAFATKVVNALA